MSPLLRIMRSLGVCIDGGSGVSRYQMHFCITDGLRRWSSPPSLGNLLRHRRSFGNKVSIKSLIK
jgi:hypothetical protein